MSDLFRKVKQAVTVRDLLYRYGHEVNKANNAVCPFHNDNKPSMHIYDNHGYDSRYNCFSCNAQGDVIDLAAVILDCDAYEAVKRIDTDFNLHLIDEETTKSRREEKHNPIATQQAEKHLNDRIFDLACDRIHNLGERLKRYTPETSENNPEYQETLRQFCNALDFADWFLDNLGKER